MIVAGLPPALRFGAGETSLSRMTWIVLGCDARGAALAVR